ADGGGFAMPFREPRYPERSTSTRVLPRGSARGDELRTQFKMRSERPIALDRHSAARARLRVIVPECLVLDAAVVPEGDGLGFPAKPHLEFLPCAELAQKVQDCAALFSSQAVNMGGELAIDVQRLPLRDGMGAN